MAKLLFDHVVVLMLEKRSFDHLFGYLGVGEGLTGVDATNYRKPGDAFAATLQTELKHAPTDSELQQAMNCNKQ